MFESSGRIVSRDSAFPVIPSEKEWGLLREYNSTCFRSNDEAHMVLSDLLGFVGENVSIRQPFHVDCGWNVSIGDDTFVNFGCTFLANATISIGKRVMIAPNVQVLTPTHPVEVEARNRCELLDAPIEICDDVWIGAGAIICPGVKIGARSVIGAGSVVIRDIPADVVAAGNPARVIRSINEDYFQ